MLNLYEIFLLLSAHYLESRICHESECHANCYTENLMTKTRLQTVPIVIIHPSIKSILNNSYSKRIRISNFP